MRNEAAHRPAGAVDRPGHPGGSPGEQSPLQARAQFLKNRGWELVVGLNRAACDRGRAQHGQNRESFEKTAAEWREKQSQVLTLSEAIEFLRQCHRQAPFLFFNGNTFADVGRTMVDLLFADLPAVRRREVASAVAHYIAGVLDRESMVGDCRDAVPERGAAAGRPRQDVARIGEGPGGAVAGRRPGRLAAGWRRRRSVEPARGPGENRLGQEIQRERTFMIACPTSFGRERTQRPQRFHPVPPGNPAPLFAFSAPFGGKQSVSTSVHPWLGILTGKSMTGISHFPVPHFLVRLFTRIARTATNSPKATQETNANAPASLTSFPAVQSPFASFAPFCGKIFVVGPMDLAQASKVLLADPQFLDDFMKQPTADFCAGMHWDGGGAAIGMNPPGVAAFLPGFDKAEFAGGASQFFGFSRHIGRSTARPPARARLDPDIPRRSSRKPVPTRAEPRRGWNPERGTLSAREHRPRNCHCHPAGPPPGNRTPSSSISSLSQKSPIVNLFTAANTVSVMTIQPCTNSGQHGWERKLEIRRKAKAARKRQNRKTGAGLFCVFCAFWRQRIRVHPCPSVVGHFDRKINDRNISFSCHPFSCRLFTRITPMNTNSPKATKETKADAPASLTPFPSVPSPFASFAPFGGKKSSRYLSTNRL